MRQEFSEMQFNLQIEGFDATLIKGLFRAPDSKFILTIPKQATAIPKQITGEGDAADITGSLPVTATHNVSIELTSNPVMTKTDTDYVYSFSGKASTGGAA